MDLTCKTKEAGINSNHENENARKYINTSQQKVYPVCSICGKPAPEGLYDGFRLVGKFVCSRCEQHIINADSTNSSYQETVEAIKKLLFD